MVNSLNTLAIVSYFFDGFIALLIFVLGVYIANHRKQSERIDLRLEHQDKCIDDTKQQMYQVAANVAWIAGKLNSPPPQELRDRYDH